MFRLNRSLLYPVLPLFGTFFTMSYFTIGIYVYNNPNIEDQTICA